MICYDYWVFYLLPQYYEEFRDELPILINDDTYVYAYTDNNDYANMFERAHDMQYFRRKKFKMTSNQVHDLTLSERNKYMKLQSLSTKYSDGIKNVDMIITLEELYAMEEMSRDKVMKLSLKMNLEDPWIFSESLKQALYNMKYFNFWRYQLGVISGGVPFDPHTFMVDIDELSVYIDLFGLLLKGGK